MNHKLLKLLQNNGTPLVITVEENGKGKQDRITRDGITVEEQYESLKHIKETLAFYPEEVWINKEKMETTQWPGLAEVRITEQDEEAWERNSKRKVDLGAPIPVPPGFNAIVGGVMTSVRLTNQQRERYEGPVLHPQTGQRSEAPRSPGDSHPDRVHGDQSRGDREPRRKIPPGNSRRI